MPLTFPEQTSPVSYEAPEQAKSISDSVDNKNPPPARDSFMAPHITGDYGHRMFSEESSLMKTPALPKNAAWISGYSNALRRLGIRG